MIQRIKKPEIKPKEERKKSPKREKPLINNKNVNNNVNTNNIVVNIPQVAPIAPKKKRKPKPKITAAAKQEFQDTLNEFAQGNFPPIDIPDITKVKTTDQLNNITNQMKAIMGKAPQAAIMGRQTPPTIMGGPTPPAIMGRQTPPAIMGSSSGSMVPPAISDSYPGTRGNAYANIVPTIQPIQQSTNIPPPPPPPKIITKIPDLMGELLVIMDKIVKKHLNGETFIDDYNGAINIYNLSILNHY